MSKSGNAVSDLLSVLSIMEKYKITAEAITRKLPLVDDSRVIARLQNAAPELLAACKSALRLIERIGPYSSHPEDRSDAVEALRRAIDLAEFE